MNVCTYLFLSNATVFYFSQRGKIEINEKRIYSDMVRLAKYNN